VLFRACRLPRYTASVLGEWIWSVSFREKVSHYHLIHYKSQTARGLLLNPRVSEARFRRRTTWAVTEPDKFLDHLSNYSCKYRVIQKDVLNWTVNGASAHARQLVAVFQVLYSLYGLTFAGYAQNSLEFVSRSPLTHANNLVQHSSHFILYWRCCLGCAIGKSSSDVTLKFGTFSFKCYVVHSYILFSSGNIDVRNWVHLFVSPCITREIEHTILFIYHVMCTSNTVIPVVPLVSHTAALLS